MEVLTQEVGREQSHKAHERSGVAAVIGAKVEGTLGTSRGGGGGGMEKHSNSTSSFDGGLYERSSTSHATHHSPNPEPVLSPQAAAAGLGNHRMIGRHVDDTELNIFDAERYFSEVSDGNKRGTVAVDGSAERCELSSVSSAEGYGQNGRSASYHATPTASSEASWNSRSGLLARPPDSAAVTMRALPRKEPRRRPSSVVRRFFGGSCPCYGRKSVDVEEMQTEDKSPIRSPMESNAPFSAKRQSFRAGEAGLSSIPERVAAEEFKNECNVEEVTKVKITPGNWGKDRSFFNVAARFSPEKTFPAEIGHRIVNSGRPFPDTAGFAIPKLCPPPANNAEEPPRESLEVFRPAEESSRTMMKSSEFHRRPIYSDEEDRPRFNYAASPKRRPEEDAASDASSDLFEIESLSTQATYRRRDSIDELEGRRFVRSSPAAEILQLRRSLEVAAPPSIAPSECYPPSEVSVEWSVATAEGFDRASGANFSSAASNYDEFRFIEEEHERFAAAMGGARRKSNGLLNCRCEKAVSVGPNPVRISPPAEPIALARITGTVSLVHERQGRPVHKI